MKKKIANILFIASMFSLKSVNTEDNKLKQKKKNRIYDRESGNPIPLTFPSPTRLNARRSLNLDRQLLQQSRKRLDQLQQNQQRSLNFLQQNQQHLVQLNQHLDVMENNLEIMSFQLQEQQEYLEENIDFLHLDISQQRNNYIFSSQNHSRFLDQHHQDVLQQLRQIDFQESLGSLNLNGFLTYQFEEELIVLKRDLQHKILHLSHLRKDLGREDLTEKEKEDFQGRILQRKNEYRCLLQRHKRIQQNIRNQNQRSLLQLYLEPLVDVMEFSGSNSIKRSYLNGNRELIRQNDQENTTLIVLYNREGEVLFEDVFHNSIEEEEFKEEKEKKEE